MRQVYLFLLIFLGVQISAQACLVCGCNSNSIFQGIFPANQYPVVGFRYASQDFTSHLLYHPSLRTSERFETVELFSLFYIKPYLQIQTQLPYQRFRQWSATEAVVSSGVGDVIILPSLRVLDHKFAWGYSSFRQQLFLGAGIKLPTGRFALSETSSTALANPQFQMGTGSFDPMAQMVYVLRTDLLGLYAQTTYRYAGNSPDYYRFGDRFNALVSLFTMKQIGRAALSFQTGFLYETMGRTSLNAVEIKETGGYSRGWFLGLDVLLGRATLGFQYNWQLAQKFGGGQFRQGNRSQVFLAYRINKKTDGLSGHRLE